MLINMTIVLLVILLIISVICLILIIVQKNLQKHYIKKAKKKIEQIIEKEQNIFYKVEDDIENKLLNIDNCRIIINGFTDVNGTIKRHWDPNDKLKLSFTIKDDSKIDIKMFFYENNDWKQIENLCNLSDGISNLKQYKLTANKNEVLKSIYVFLYIVMVSCGIALFFLSCLILFFNI